MADGLLSSGLGMIDRAKQTLAARFGLLASNPEEFARQLAAEQRQRAGVGLLGEPKTAQEMASGAWINTPYGQQAMEAGSGFVGSIKPKINMQVDQANRFVFRENKNPNIILTTSRDEFDPKYMNAYLEVLDNPEKVGGKGTATRLYLEALDIAKKNNMGWKSDVVRSDATQRMYERLKNMGIPFENVDDQFILSPEQLSKINLQKLPKK